MAITLTAVTTLTSSLRRCHPWECGSGPLQSIHPAWNTPPPSPWRRTGTCLLEGRLRHGRNTLNPVEVNCHGRALSHGGGTNNIVFQLTDEQHIGFVAKINGGTGQFEAVQRVETGPAFSPSRTSPLTLVTAMRCISSERWALVLHNAGCPANGPTEDAHFVGKAAPTTACG